MTWTTLDLDPAVVEQLRMRAAAERKSMGQVASEHLARRLGDELPAELPPLKWVRKPMDKLFVDIEDKDALWASLDADDLGTERD